MTGARSCLKASCVHMLTNEQFVPRSEPPALPDGEIHVWFFPQWPHPRDSAKSPIVREWLAHYLNTVVANVHVGVGPNGKPGLRDGKIHFNLSHSGNAMLLAIRRDGEVGVDLEFSRRPRQVVELAKRWFDPAEAAALHALPQSLRQRAFLNLWTCKEAVLKADGRGIASGLHRVVFSLTDDGEIAGILDRSWNVVRMDPAPGHPGAVAWQGPDVPVRAFVYTAK